MKVACVVRAGGPSEKDPHPRAPRRRPTSALWRNLVEAVEKVVRQHQADLRAPAPDTDTTCDTAAAQTSDGVKDDSAGSAGPARLATRTRERHETIHALLAAGTSVSAIGQTLGLDPKTVRRFVRADSADELLTVRSPQASVLDDYTPHLQQRWAAGVTDAVALTAEITALGYRGSAKTVRRYLQPLRSGQPTTSRPPAPATARDATGWLTRHPDSLTDDECAARDTVLDRSPALRAGRDQVSEFAQILTQRRGHELKGWIQRVDTDGAPAMRSFATGLERDLDAVTAGLTLPYSSGPVEGTVNRIKMIKRQMFGRANFDLLRKRVLLAT